MTKKKAVRPIRVGDTVEFLVQTGPFSVGQTGTVVEFKNSNDGQQAYIEIGGSGITMFVTDLALVQS